MKNTMSLLRILNFLNYTVPKSIELTLNNSQFNIKEKIVELYFI